MVDEDKRSKQTRFRSGGFSLDDVVLKPLQNGDYIDIKTSCGDLASLIPDLEDMISKGRNTGLLAFYHDVCIGSIIGTLDVESTVTANDSPIPLPHVRIFFLEVNRIYRDHGVGTLLLEEFIERMKQKDIAFIFVSVYTTHVSGWTFFEKFGFQKEKVLRNQVIMKLSIWSDFGVVSTNDIDE